MLKQAAEDVGEKAGGQVWYLKSRNWVVTYFDEDIGTYYMVGTGRRIDVGGIEQFRRMYPEAWLYRDFSPLNLRPHPIFR